MIVIAKLIFILPTKRPKSRIIKILQFEPKFESFRIRVGGPDSNPPKKNVYPRYSLTSSKCCTDNNTCGIQGIPQVYQGTLHRTLTQLIKIPIHLISLMILKKRA